VKEIMQKVLFSKDLIAIMMQGENLFNRTDIKVFTAATTDDILKIHVEETLNLIVTMLDLPGTPAKPFSTSSGSRRNSRRSLSS
jgi:hypothetical protein